jgi:hypothetical protein
MSWALAMVVGSAYSCPHANLQPQHGSRHAPRRIVALLCALSFAVCAAAPSAAQASARRVPAEFVGMNAQFLFFRPGDQWGPNLQAMAAAGVETVRSDASWQWVEANPPQNGAHRYNWDPLDLRVWALAKHGLRWAPTIGWSTPWDRTVAGLYISPPAGIDNYAAYAGALAARYGDHGSFWSLHPELPYLPVHSWEIWNEENLPGFWSPAPDPTRYADLYLAARAAIHAAQPRATVFVGGLSNHNWAEFLDGMFAQRPKLRGQIDGVGFHPYTANVDDSIATVVAFRHKLVALGEPNVPIAITEVGWPTAGPVNVLSDDGRAYHLSALTDRLARSDCGISSISPHTWIALGQDPTNQEDSYGLVHADGTPSKSEIAYSLVAQELEGSMASPISTAKLYLCGTATPATTSPRRSLPPCARPVILPASRQSAPASSGRSSLGPRRCSRSRLRARRPARISRTHKARTSR